jgi:cyclophilin family peptidyl-prolyl cis-trans isomerase
MNCPESHFLRSLFSLRTLPVILLGLCAPVLAVPPNAPKDMATSLTIADAATYVVRLAWTDNSTDEDFFRILQRGSTSGQGIIRDLSTQGGIKESTGALTYNLPVPAASEGNGFILEWAIAAGKSGALVEVSDPTSYEGHVWNPFPSPSFGAPSGLSVVPSGDGSFQVSFSDNSNNERFFQIDYKETSSSTWIESTVDFNIVSVDVGGYQTRTMVTDMFIPVFLPGTSYDFRVRAADWAGTTNFTAYTSTETASTNAFAGPTNLVATPSGEASFDLSFDKNSTAESGYEFQFRQVGELTWNVLGQLDDPLRNLVNTGTLIPGADYEFRVLAYIRDTNNPSDPPVQYSDPSNIATGSTTFSAPTNLMATSPSEGLVDLFWEDNSTVEGNYVVQARVKGTSQWFVWDFFVADTTSITDQLVLPGETMEFRVRATRGAQAEVQSDFSNIAEIMVPFAGPTGLSSALGAGSTSESEVTLMWTENSTIEGGIGVFVRESGESDFTLIEYTAADATSYTVTGLTPGVMHEFQVASAVDIQFPTNGVQVSDPSNTVSETTNDGITSRAYEPITFDQSFSYTVTTSSGSARTGWSVTNLPAGLSFDDSTGEISGTPTEAGVFVCPMSATFASGWTSNRDLTLRIIRAPGPPVAGNAFSAQFFNVGDPTVMIPLADKFIDDDSQSAVRVTTNQGSFDILLYQSEVPLTYANFMNYVNGGDYDGSIFHRSVPGFVVQGGGFAPSTTTPGNMVSLDTDPPVTNEPGISNETGTVAFAKLGGDPDSATNQFFVNQANNNSSNSNSLDNQNGGFTVFGRVAGGGMNTVNSIGSLPRATYTIPLEDELGASQGDLSFEGFPVNDTSAPADYDPTKVVEITSVAPVPVLAYNAVSGDTGVATVTVSGTSLEVTPVAVGTTSVTVTATDLDGNSEQQMFDVTVSITLDSWAASLGVPSGEDDPEDDIEMDGLTLLEDFAFVGTPTGNDRDKLPTTGVEDNGGTLTGCITFRMRKDASTLRYEVEANGQLTGMWSSVWDSSQGFTPANVTAVDEGTHWSVTVKDSTPVTQGSPRFMRVRLTIVTPPS